MYLVPDHTKPRIGSEREGGSVMTGCNVLNAFLLDPYPPLAWPDNYVVRFLLVTPPPPSQLPRLDRRGARGRPALSRTRYLVLARTSSGPSVLLVVPSRLVLCARASASSRRHVTPPPRRPLPGKFSCFDTNVRPDSVVVGHCEVCPGRKRRPCLRTLKPRSKFLTTVLLSSFSRPQNSTDALPAVYARCSPLMTAAMHRGIVAGCRRIGRRSLPKVELLLLLLCSCVQGT